MKTSHEKLAINRIRDSFLGIPGIQIHVGQSRLNRFEVSGWNLISHQLFQYSDMRVESPEATVVIEFESAGGLTNLVKYWPFLATRSFTKRLVLAHVFRIVSEFDYVAHRKLWEFVLAKMRIDLEQNHSVEWPKDWEAAIFTYRAPEHLTEVLTFVRRACGVPTL